MARQMPTPIRYTALRDFMAQRHLDDLSYDQWSKPISRADFDRMSQELVSQQPDDSNGWVWCESREEYRMLMDGKSPADILAARSDRNRSQRPGTRIPHK